MVITEMIKINGKEFVHNYSSLGFYIERDGLQFEEAIDLPEMGHVYFETGILISADGE
jgi:hypothetical protein